MIPLALMDLCEKVMKMLWKDSGQDISFGIVLTVEDGLAQMDESINMYSPPAQKFPKTRVLIPQTISFAKIFMKKGAATLAFNSCGNAQSISLEYESKCKASFSFGEIKPLRNSSAVISCPDASEVAALGRGGVDGGSGSPGGPV